MTTISCPAIAPDPELTRTTDLLLRRERIAPEHVALRRRCGEDWHEVTTAAFADQVRATARGLIAAGVEPGSIVAVLSPTRYEWAVVDMAIWWAGGVSVPVYDTASIRQAAHAFTELRPMLAIVAGQAERMLLVEAAQLAQVPTPSIWTMDAGPDDLDALRQLGDDVEAGLLEQQRLARGADDDATIVYTSGTTGMPHGVRITHRNLVEVVRAVASAYSEVINERASTVIFLPLAHVLARGLQVAALATGMGVSHLADPRALVATLPTLRPTFLVVAPRVLQRIRAAVRDKASAAKIGRLYERMDRAAVEWGRYLEQHERDASTRPSRRLRLAHAVGERLFYRRIRALLGDNVQYLLSGAATLGAELSHYFRGVGVPVIEGYGLTETTAPATGQRAGDIRAGTVGIPVPGTEVRLADDGEIQIRGVGVTPGYTDPAITQSAVTEDGWLRTGDIGAFGDDGHLTVTGRLKDTIVTANGKNIEPARWEAAVEAHPLVAHAVMVGSDRPYAAAVLLLDLDAAADWAHRSGKTELEGQLRAPAPGEGRVIDDDALRAEVKAAVAAANQDLSRAEQARRFTLASVDLAPLETPTLKLRRREFLSRADHLVEQLYA